MKLYQNHCSYCGITTRLTEAEKNSLKVCPGCGTGAVQEKNIKRIK